MDKRAQTNLSSLIKHIAMLIKDDSGERRIVYKWKHVNNHHEIVCLVPLLLFYLSLSRRALTNTVIQNEHQQRAL